MLAATFVTKGDFPAGIGFLGVALAFGLTVTTGAYALGHISGGHFNPAVTAGLWVAKRVQSAIVLPYMAAQVIGASVAGGILFIIASGQPGFDAVASGFATNGYGELSPRGLFARRRPHHRGRPDRVRGGDVRGQRQPGRTVAAPDPLDDCPDRAAGRRR